MGVRKDDFLNGATDAVTHVHFSHLERMLVRHYDETGEIDWYMAGQLTAAKMMDKV